MKTIIKILTTVIIAISFSSCQTTQPENDKVIPQIQKCNTVSNIVTC
ncbi:MAG: hypothetical protein ACSHX6_03435 [Akkermansiaceae bacterium]